MKLFGLLTLTLFLLCCENRNSNERIGGLERKDSIVDVIKKADIAPDSVSTLFDYEYKDFKKFSLSETIVDDFDSDSTMDSATFVHIRGKAGIIIKNGRTAQIDTFGAGIDFAEMRDDFSWVDSWGLLKDSLTYEVIIKGSEIIGEERVTLINPSIFVQKEEVGGGVITFKNGKWEWIHQAD